MSSRNDQADLKPEAMQNGWRSADEIEQIIEGALFEAFDTEEKNLTNEHRLRAAGKKIQDAFAGVPEEEIHQITWANGARMYGIE